MTIDEINKVSEFLKRGEELEREETRKWDEFQTLISQVMKNSHKGIMADGRGDNND